MTTQLTSAKPAQLEQVSDKGGRGKEGGMARASRMLGLDCSEVIRSIKISKLPVEVKQAVVDAGLADNQAAMLRIAAEQSLDAQLTAVGSERERAEAPRKSKADRDVARESAASLAAFILQRTDPGSDERAQVVAWLESCTPKAVIDEMQKQAQVSSL